jgi:glutathione synthase/RimK-type ligase-like ATP-grasp enzyme
MNSILTITSNDDPHVAMVQRHLSIPIDVFDPKLFPFDNDITYKILDGKLEVISKEKHLEQVCAIWFRKPEYVPPNKLPVAEPYKMFAGEAYKTAVRMLYDLLKDKFWLSDVRSILVASNKVYQLQLAQSLGFQVPKTIVTSNPLEATNFRTQVGSIVTKSLTFTPVLKEDGTYAFYTTRIGPDDVVDFSGLVVAPAIFQQEISPKRDIRVTIVGNQFFPCEVSIHGKYAGAVDWRIGITTDNVTYAYHQEFPDNLKTKCSLLLKALGLSFGVVEFAIDRDGDYWFLEINPNGQWAFVELATGMQISKAIAAILLCEGST